MIKPAIALAVLAATTAPAVARDSTWLLCKGVSERGAADKPKEKDRLVVNLLERRGASDRDLDVVLLYGSHVASGTITGGGFQDKPTAVKLVTDDGKHHLVFSGMVKLSADFHAFTLKGDYDLTFGADPKWKREPFEAKLACEELDEASVGH